MKFSSRCMTPDDWREIRHFTPDEFKSPDRMGYEFMRWLDQLRETAGVPMHITSSYRSPAHNRAVGGAKDSAHTDVPCNAVDIGERPTASDPNWNYSRWQIVSAAMALGCVRIGMYANGSLHLDLTHDTRPSPRMWRVVGAVGLTTRWYNASSLCPPPSPLRRRRRDGCGRRYAWRWITCQTTPRMRVSRRASIGCVSRVGVHCATRAKRSLTRSRAGRPAMRSDEWLSGFRWSAFVGTLFMTLAWMLSGCALYQLSQPPRPSVAPRECVGRYIHPDSAGHCVPRDTTGGGNG